MTRKKKEKSAQTSSNDWLGSLLNIGKTKEHILKAGQEALLASEGVIDLVQAYCKEKHVDKVCPQLDGLILATKDTVRQISKNAFSVTEQSKNKVREDVILSIIEALNKEISGLERKRNSAQKRYQLDAFKLVIKFLSKHMHTS